MPELPIEFQISGSGQNVFFLHGFMESMSMWESLDLESAPFRSIKVDLPGHGATALDDSEENPSITYFAKMVMQLADHLKLDSYAVVGHSMGGYVALVLKQLDPRCGKLVLLHSNFWTDSEQKKKDRIRMADLAFQARERLVREAIPGLFFKAHATEKMVKDLISEALQMTSEGIAYASLAMRLRIDQEKLIRIHSSHVCIIQGAHDPLFPSALMEERIREIPVHYVLIPNAGHMGHLEDSSAVRKAVIDFLA